MKTTLFLIFLFGTFFIVQAQSPFREGLVVLEKGDTLKGYVQDREWRYSPIEITFQQIPDGPITIYTLDEVKGFSFRYRNSFEKFNIEYDGAWQDPARLPRTKEPEERIKKVIMLEYLFKSQISLLYFLDETNRPHYFYKEAQGNPVELLNRKFAKTINGREYAETYEKWKQQVIVLAIKCPELHSAVVNLSYSQKDLVNIFRKVNSCYGAEELAEKKPEAENPRVKSKFGIVAHCFLNKTEFEFGYFPMKSIHFAGGISYQHFSRTRPTRISGFHELVFQQINEDGGYPLFYWPEPIPLNLDAAFIRMANSFRSTLPGQRVSLFANVGVVNNFRIKAKLTLMDKRDAWLLPENWNHEYRPGVETGFTAGGGLQTKVYNIPLSLESRYEYLLAPFDGDSGVGSILSGSQNVRIILGIQFR